MAGCGGLLAQIVWGGAVPPQGALWAILSAMGATGFYYIFGGVFSGKAGAEGEEWNRGSRNSSPSARASSDAWGPVTCVRPRRALPGDLRNQCAYGRGRKVCSLKSAPRASSYRVTVKNAKNRPSAC